MGDAANAATRNLYPKNDGTRFTASYMDGRGMTYDEALHKLSWPVCTDVPALGQRSSHHQLPVLKKVYGLNNGQIYLHPAEYTKLRHTDHLSFSKSQGHLGTGALADPQKNVYQRLYMGQKSMSKLGQRDAKDRLEMAGDVAFKNCTPYDAVELYSRAIEKAPKGQPNLFAYEKRCAANAELGRYREALDDAQYILDWTFDPAKRGSALMRVKTIKDFLRRNDNFEAGYHNSTSTLICLLRPREHRQLVPSHPATYGRPDSAATIGKGISASASMASLLQWDTDGDGNIDDDEFRQAVSSLGYTMKKQGKHAFKGSGTDQRGFI